MLDIVTEQKREDLLKLVRAVLGPCASVKGVVCVGSVALGSARGDSDIDAIVFFDPLDYHVVPGEFAWSPSRGSFHSIFSGELPDDAIQFDLARLALPEWSSPAFQWPEERCYELAEGWIAYDPTGGVRRLIESRARYRDEDRLPRLDESVVWLDQLLNGPGIRDPGRTLGEAEAHERLNAAYDYLVQALFALNRRWRPWRSRQTKPLLGLPWLPEGFSASFLSLCTAPSSRYEGYEARVGALRRAFTAVTDRIHQDADYGADPVSAAFRRTHNEPGYAWNMAEWDREHRWNRRDASSPADEGGP